MPQKRSFGSFNNPHPVQDPKTDSTDKKSAGDLSEVDEEEFTENGKKYRKKDRQKVDIMIEPFYRKDEPIDVDEIYSQKKPVVVDKKALVKKKKNKLQFV